MSETGFSLADATVDSFAPHVGDFFGVVEDGSEKELTRITLLSALELRTVAEGRSPFSLVFEGPADPPLEQGTYWLSNECFGTQPIFVVPIAGDSEKRQYEAIFS